MMGLFDAIRAMFSDDDDDDDFLGWSQDDDDMPFGNLGSDGIADWTDYIDYIIDEIPIGAEKIELEFLDFQSAIEYANDAPPGVLGVLLTDGGPVVYRTYNNIETISE